MTTPRRAVTSHLQSIPYLAPALTILTVFLFLPLVAVLVLSLFDWNLLGSTPRFVGFQNYGEILGDGTFLRLFGQTLAYFALALVGNLVFPLALAVLTTRVSARMAGLYRSVLFIPTVISTTVGAIIWQYLYLPAGGPINEVLAVIGITGPNWLSDPATAIPAIALISSWNTFGFNYLIAIGGLSAIPVSLLEAARLDGAHGVKMLKDITLPLISPTLLFLGVATILQALPNAFVAIQITTGGGPNGATENLFSSIYRDAFGFFQAGKGAAGAVILIVLLLVLVGWQYRMTTKRINYGD